MSKSVECVDAEGGDEGRDLRWCRRDLVLDCCLE